MVNTRFMYLRPGSIFKYFTIESSRQVITGTGRVAESYGSDGAARLKGCLARASAEERENHSQKDHVVTHTVVQPGRPKAKKSDRLVLGNRVFYIVDVNDASSLGVSTIYYAEERKGTI